MVFEFADHFRNTWWWWWEEEEERRRRALGEKRVGRGGDRVLAQLRPPAASGNLPRQLFCATLAPKALSQITSSPSSSSPRNRLPHGAKTSQSQPGIEGWNGSHNLQRHASSQHVHRVPSVPPSPRSLRHRSARSNRSYYRRPPAAAHTPKAFLRVHLHRQSLQKLSLKSGDLIELAKASLTNGTNITWIPAIAWLAADAQLQRHCALLSEAVKERLGVSFENEVLVRKYLPDVEGAETVVVTEVESDIPQPPMADEQAEGWRWQVEHALCEQQFQTRQRRRVEKSMLMCA